MYLDDLKGCFRDRLRPAGESQERLMDKGKDGGNNKRQDNSPNRRDFIVAAAGTAGGLGGGTTPAPARQGEPPRPGLVTEAALEEKLHQTARAGVAGGYDVRGNDMKNASD